MRPHRAVLWLLTIGTLATSMMCSLIPVPPQIAPTTDPMQKTVDVRLTDLARPTPTPTETITPRPTDTPTVTASPLPPTATLPKPGSITGKLSYPGPSIPPLRVVTFKINESKWKSIDTAKNVVIYTFNDLPPGKYYVVSYPVDSSKTDPTFGGAYTRAVLCGISTQCTDHSLIEVEVKSGEITKNINLTDWYARIGTFPKNPSIP
jgi:hypothetical protein